MEYTICSVVFLTGTMLVKTLYIVQVPVQYQAWKVAVLKQKFPTLKLKSASSSLLAAVIAYIICLSSSYCSHSWMSLPCPCPITKLQVWPLCASKWCSFLLAIGSFFIFVFQSLLLLCLQLRFSSNKCNNNDKLQIEKVSALNLTECFCVSFRSLHTSKKCPWQVYSWCHWCSWFCCL